MADLSKLSTEDLLALKDGDLSKVSTDGLKMLRTSQVREQIDADPISQGARNFAADMPFLDKFNAGMGKAFSDVGSAAKQLVGGGPDAAQVAEQRKLDAPLMKTGGGLAGNVGGNLAILAPLAVVPGAASVGGAAALGATAGALQPTKDATERGKNMVLGGVLGGGSQFVGTKGAQVLGERAAAKEAAASQNAVRDATLTEAQKAGYVVPPSAVNPSFLNKRVESIGGKAAVGQEAAGRNQLVTNKLARETLGLADDAPITVHALEKLRDTAAAPYREVAAISPQAATALEQLKQARFDANAYFKHYAVSADPASLKTAQQSAQTAQQLETALEQAAVQAGKPDLIPALRAARQQIAKSYEVERALNVATGDVSARALGASLDKGKPLSGGLLTAGNFAEAFPAYARDAAKIPTPGVSKSEALTAALLGTLGYGATGNPLGMAAAALPLASGPARSMVLSKPYQSVMAKPSGPMLPSKAYDPKAIAEIARLLALPAVPYATEAAK